MLFEPRHSIVYAQQGYPLGEELVSILDAAGILDLFEEPAILHIAPILAMGCVQSLQPSVLGIIHDTWRKS